MLLKKGSLQFHLMPIDEDQVIVQVLRVVDDHDKEIPVFWTDFPGEVMNDEKLLLRLIDEAFAHHEMPREEIFIRWAEPQFPPKSAHFPIQVKQWKPRPCKTPDEVRFDLSIFIPLDPKATESFLSREEARESLKTTEWEDLERAIRASIDFEILFGYHANGAGTGFGYRDMDYYALTKKQLDEMRPEAERILGEMGYRLGRGRMRARVEVDRTACEKE